MHQRNNNTNNDMTIQALRMHIIQHRTIIRLQYLYIQYSLYTIKQYKLMVTMTEYI